MGPRIDRRAMAWSVTIDKLLREHKSMPKFVIERAPKNRTEFLTPEDVRRVRHRGTNEDPDIGRHTDLRSGCYFRGGTTNKFAIKASRRGPEHLRQRFSLQDVQVVRSAF